MLYRSIFEHKQVSSKELQAAPVYPIFKTKIDITSVAQPTLGPPTPKLEQAMATYIQQRCQTRGSLGSFPITPLAPLMYIRNGKKNKDLFF